MNSASIRLAPLVLAVLSPAALGQVEAPSFDNVPFVHDTGWVAPGGAAGGGLELCASFNVDQEGAEWIRLYFEDVVLAGDPLAGTGAELRITSMLDGGLQIMNAIEVERWERSTAYFNGDSLVVEVWARPGTGTSRVQLEAMDMGTPPLLGTASICGPNDDRLPSTDPRSGRLLPVGCTGWLIQDCAGCFLTAGHCTGNIQVIQFNVPPSSSSGSCCGAGTMVASMAAASEEHSRTTVALSIGGGARPSEPCSAPPPPPPRSGGPNLMDVIAPGAVVAPSALVRARQANKRRFPRFRRVSSGPMPPPPLPPEPDPEDPDSMRIDELPSHAPPPPPSMPPPMDEARI